jgi:hypothetical protein
MVAITIAKVNNTTTLWVFEYAWNITDNTVSYSITRFTTVSPFGLQTSSVVRSSFNSRHYYANVTWTPTSSQFGLQQYCFRAVSSNGYNTLIASEIIYDH